MDEWVSVSRIDLTKSQQEVQNQSRAEIASKSGSPKYSERKITRNQKRKHDEINHVQQVLWTDFLMML